MVYFGRSKSFVHPIQSVSLGKVSSSEFQYLSRKEYVITFRYSSRSTVKIIRCQYSSISSQSDVRISLSLRKDIRCQNFSFSSQRYQMSIFSVSSQRYQMSVFQYLFAKISDVSISVSLRKDIRCQYFSISSQRYQMSVFQSLFAKISSVSIYESSLVHCQGVYIFRDIYCCIRSLVAFV